jgi:hypothetical protein
MMTSIRPLPVTLDEITPEWLTAALRRATPDITVHAVEIVDIIHGTCTKLRLRLDLNQAAKRAGIPETLFLKGGFEPHSRDMDFMHAMEVRGYRDVLPFLGLPCPTPYFADFDPERRQGIVILEDLVARGVEFCNPLIPQTHDQVARRLCKLAQFHAKTWASPELQSGGRWNELPELMGMLGHFAHYLEPKTWQKFVAMPQGAAASVRFHDRAWVALALQRIAKLAERLPQAVLHTDTHLGNLYVDRDGTPGFFDSLTSRGPAMLEVTYHVGGALDTADRPRWEGALLRHYLDELSRNGVDAPSFDEAMRQFGAFLVYGYLVFLINETDYQSSAVNTAYTARFSAAMIDHDTIGLLAAIDP